MTGGDLTKLARDASVTEHTTIQGTFGILDVLREYFSDDNPKQSTQDVNHNEEPTNIKPHSQAIKAKSTPLGFTTGRRSAN